MELDIKVTGYRTDDLEMALDRIKRIISEGYTSGKDKNSTGSYLFSITGDEVESFIVVPADVDENDIDADDYEHHPVFDDALLEAGSKDTVFGVTDNNYVFRIT